MHEFHVVQKCAIRNVLIVLLPLLVVLLAACGNDASPASTNSLDVTPPNAGEAVTTPAEPTAVPTPEPTNTPMKEVATTASAPTTATAIPPTTANNETGLQSAGSMLVIAGRDVQLPATVWLKSWITDLSCTDGQKCPPTPYLTLQSDDSTIEIDGNGKIWNEAIGCGDPEPFKSVKNLLR